MRLRVLVVVPSNALGALERVKLYSQKWGCFKVDLPWIAASGVVKARRAWMGWANKFNQRHDVTIV